MDAFILSIDAGTTGVQASLFRVSDLSLFANHKVEFPQIYPQPGFVEHDPKTIWGATLASIGLVLKIAEQKLISFSRRQIVAIGITNQRETCLAWNKRTGEIAHNAIVWQDRRTTQFCNSLKEDDTKRKLILEKTGLVCDPYFSASKMKWLVENIPKVSQWSLENELALGTIDSYLVWKLTGEGYFVTDHTNASRTMLYNLHTGRYDEELLVLFHVPLKALAEIKPSCGKFGATKKVPDVPDGIPITAVLGDQQAALFGQVKSNRGGSKITFGTGAFLLLNTGSNIVFSGEGLLTTVAYSAAQKRTFALEGSAFIAGAGVQFLRDQFDWIKNSFETDQIAMNCEPDEDILFVPSLTGLGAPYWNPKAKGVLFGLTRGAQKSQIIRAVLELILCTL